TSASAPATCTRSPGYPWTRSPWTRWTPDTVPPVAGSAPPLRTPREEPLPRRQDDRQEDEQGQQRPRDRLEPDGHGDGHTAQEERAVHRDAVQNTHGRRRLARAPSSISPAPATRAPRAVPPTLGIRSGASSTPAAMSPAPTPKSTPNSSASPPLA